MLEVDQETMMRIVNATDPHMKAHADALHALFGKDTGDALDLATGYMLGVLISRANKSGHVKETLATLNFMVRPIGCAIAHESSVPDEAENTMTIGVSADDGEENKTVVVIDGQSGQPFGPFPSTGAALAWLQSRGRVGDTRWQIDRVLSPAEEESEG